MIAFINESSIEAHEDLRAGLQFFWLAALELQAAQIELYRNSAFFFTPEFARRFNALGFRNDPQIKLPPDLRSRLREVAFSEKFWRCWRPNRLSAECDEYTCEIQENAISDNSICEAAEVKFQQEGSDVGLLSAADSVYAKAPSVLISKEHWPEQVELRNADSLKLIRRWITGQKGHYDPDSTSAPRDFQTVLEKDPERFQRTERFWNVAGQDRRIYRETSTGRFFYVDEGHPGHSAHLEVFDADGKHLGEAHIATGVLDTSKKDKDKYIRI